MYFNPYSHFSGRDLTLSDHLAIDRTVLANERTALAYGRTVLAMLVVGGTCLKFFDSWYMWTIGGVFIAVSFVVAGVGWRRFNRTRRYLAAALQHHTGAPDHPLREQATDAQPVISAAMDARAPSAESRRGSNVSAGK